MSSITFDTLKFVEKLEAGGFSKAQAKAAAHAFAEATSEQLVTKSDIKEELSSVKTDISVMKWMLGFTVAILVALLFLQLRR